MRRLHEERAYFTSDYIKLWQTCFGFMEDVILQRIGHGVKRVLDELQWDYHRDPWFIFIVSLRLKTMSWGENDGSTAAQRWRSP